MLHCVAPLLLTSSLTLKQGSVEPERDGCMLSGNHGGVTQRICSGLSYEQRRYLYSSGLPLPVAARLKKRARRCSDGKKPVPLIQTSVLPSKCPRAFQKPTSCTVYTFWTFGMAER